MSAPHVLVSGVVLGQPMGGVRRHNAELLPRVAALLRAHGGSLALLEGREPIAFPLPEGIERIASDVPAAPPFARARRESRALRTLIAERARAGRPFDCVHTGHLPVPSSLPLPYALTIHDLRGTDARSVPAGRRIVAHFAIRRAVERAAVVLTVSETVRAEILARFRAPADRVRIVANAADHFVPLPRATEIAAPILCVGHLEPRKNLDVVLEALRLDPELPPLVLAGAPKQSEEERLRRKASALGIAARVTFLGSFEEAALAGLYARAACVVLPSRIEGFGIGALEAQSAHVPLAVANIPALIEVAGGDAPSFEPDDARGCAGAIRRALRMSSGELDRAAANAARYRWDDSARAWFEALCSIRG
jgi:glycosyltransferase involved in cell wall biosynthesis